MITANNDKLIYIIDGPDCTGKTDYSKKISRKLDIPYYHLTYYKDKDKHLNQFIEIYNKIINKNENDKGFVLDRYILSEIVYSDIYRNSEYFNTQWLINILGNFLNDKNIVKILSLPKDKERYIKFFNDNLKSRKEMYVEKQSEVYDRYDFYKNLIGVDKFQIFDLFDYIDETTVNK